MFKNLLLLVGGVFFLLNSIHGQCPDKDSLIRKLASPVVNTERLNELIQYESRLKNCKYRGDSTNALLLQKIGLLYFKQHQYSNAFKYIKLSNNLIISPNNKSNVDLTLLVENYYIMSAIFNSWNMMADRMVFLDSCISVFYRSQNHKNIYNRIKFVLKALETRTQSKYDVGEYNDCSRYASMGEVWNQKLYGDTKESIVHSIYFLTWKVNALLIMGKYPEAEGLLKNKVEEYKRRNSYESLGTIYDLLGQVQINKKNPLEAIDFFQQSLTYDRKSNRTIACMQTYINLGYHVYDRYYHNNQMALDCYQKGWVCFSASESPSESGKMDALNLLTNIANLFVQSGSYDSAFRYFQLAFDQIKPGLHESGLLDISLDKIPKVEYLTSLLLDEADAYYKLFKEFKDNIYFDKAISIYKITDRLLDKIKTEQSDIQSKLFWRRDNHRLYERAIEACFSFGNKTDDAFYFFEKSRATLLNDQITEQQFLGNQDIFKQAHLKNKLFKLQKQMSMADVSSDSYTEVQNEWLQCNEQLDRIQQENKSKNGQAFQKFFESSITIKNVQEHILKGHHALIELFEGDSAVYMILITPRKVSLQKINKADYDSTLQLYLSYISSSSLVNRNAEGYYNTARHLYRLLFADNPLPSSGRIIVSPDGGYFPFEALITNNRKAPAYFVYKYAVSYTYSARYLLIVNKYNRKAAAGTRTLLGMAPVSYKYDTTLHDLTESDQSVRQVQSYFTDADTMMFDKATKTYFLQNFYKYKINYLSTHASDSGSMGEPVIYFADEPMSLSELVAETKPETELVIASACKTGIGKIYRGEGVYNFSRAFASVGIPACVNNLWSVQASSANRLIELFCKYIEQGQPTDVALQKAKIEFIRSAKDGRKFPYYWAASILSGKSGIIESKHKKPFPWTMAVVLGLLGFLAAAGGALAIRRRRQTIVTGISAGTMAFTRHAGM